MSDKFILPLAMQQYATLSDFLTANPPNNPEEINLISTLMANSYQNMSLNMSMFSINSIDKFTSWKSPETWKFLFDSEVGEYEINRAFIKLRNISARGNTIFPNENEIFRAFELCEWDKLKVVILGQDPYPNFDELVNLPMGSGLSFSGRRGGKNPNSLNKVFKELNRTFPGIRLDHHDLTTWAQQGVLLLNTCLTVNQGAPESHIKERVWNDFIDLVLRTICEYKPGTIFCLWGAKAKAFAGGTNPPINSKKCIVLECGHPSGINTSKTSTYDENNHFAYIYYIIQQRNQEIYNQNLKLHTEGKQLLPYINQIDWSLI